MRIPAADRWRRIAPLLEEALELPPDRRGPFLDRACGRDAGLRAEIEDLLRADSEAGAFLGAPLDLSAIVAEPGEVPDPAAGGGEPLAGATIGPFRVVREIGRGGMGVVYEAEQQRPRRAVALKVILGGRHVDAGTVRMFQREADSLARLKHPGIAAIYESGSTDEGQHYFAMELVPGRPLSAYLDEHRAAETRPEVRRRLALFRKIGAAVAYAHQRGVIHRDLKPSNILVLEHPDGAEPDIKVLDFGLARITDPDAGAVTAVTAIGRIQGTLPYMSPDQVRGRGEEVDARTDVYALGVILYRLLTGRLPYDLDDVDFPAAARIICEQPPMPLRVAAGGKAKFDPDLTVILLKALEKEPARRYPTVAALDDDIARYLGGQPILARPASAAYQIGKLVSRHKLAFAAVGSLVVLLAGFAAAMTLQARRIADERDRANREARTALRVSDFLTGLFKVSDPSKSRGNAITAREILDEGVGKIEKELADEPEVQARLLLTMGNVYGNLGDLERARPILERSLEMRCRLLGEENLDTLASMNALALQYRLMARSAEAEKLYERLIEIRRRIQGEDHPDTLVAMAGLADVYWTQGRYAEKEKIDRHVLEVRRRILGDDHLDTISSMVDVAYACWLLGRYAESEALYVPALEKERRLLGDDHPETLLTMHNLGNLYDEVGRYADAEKLLRQTLEVERRVLGDAHPNSLILTNDLAIVLQHQNRFAEAEALLHEVLGKFRSVLGEEHRMTIGTMANLGNVISDQGRHAEGEVLLREALGKMRRILGEDYPDTVSTLYSLGCVAALRGDRRAALDWLGQAVAHGYSTADLMAQDTHLKGLSGDPDFEAIVARARKNSGG